MKTHAELYPGTDPNCLAILAPIEPGVRPLCDALNALPDTYTLWSCEGHPEMASTPFVTFVAPQEIAFKLSRLIECSPFLKFNWTMSACFREDGSLQYTVRPDDIRFIRKGIVGLWPRMRWSYDEMCIELSNLSQLISQGFERKIDSSHFVMIHDFSELVFSTPTSHKAIFNSDKKTKIDLLIAQIEVINVTEMIWWAYRVPPHNCIACDIYGANVDKSLNISITIAGETVIPSCPEEEPFEFQDETDAWFFLTLLVEKLQLKHVKSISEGLGLHFSRREIER
jgi:hypothetical protein